MRKWAFIIVSTYLLMCQGCALDNINDTIQKDIHASTSISLAATLYHAACGKWPHSSDEIVKFSLDCKEAALDPNLIKVEKSANFEELPDGKLKITTSDTSSSFTIILDVPNDSNGIPPDLAHCCGEANKK